MEMHTGRQFFPLVFEPQSKAVFAIGGWSSEEGLSLDKVEKYDPTRSEWYPLASLN